MESFDDELMQSFVEESLEHLADIENDLLLIEEAGASIDDELVNKIFRAAHSVKGSAGFLGLNVMKELAHKAENVLGLIRDKEIVPDSENVNILLMAFDKLRDLLDNVDTSNEVDITDYVVALNGITSAGLPEEEKPQLHQTVEVTHPNGETVFIVSEFDIAQAKKRNASLYLVDYDLIHDVQRKNISPLDLIKKLEASGNIIDCKIDITAVGTLDSQEFTNQLPFRVLFSTGMNVPEAIDMFDIDANKIHLLDDDLVIQATNNGGHEILTPPVAATAPNEIPADNQVNTIPEQDQPAQETPEENNTPAVDSPSPKTIDKTPAESAPAAAEPSATKTSKQKQSQTAHANQSLRVNVSLLDSLMTLAGELVLSRNQLIQAEASKDQGSIEAATQRINLVTSELQEAIMLTRMQPIGNVFNKFPRVVRDLAKNLGKNIDLSISGKDVEVDKTIVEALADPLTHLVRNSADHGIEDPDVRANAGKSETGTIQLNAYQQSGQVNIEIIDDGKGIDADKLAESAISKGLITEAEAAAMSQKEKTALILMPGFSMAEKVTDVSGRGVGMDVVKSNLSKLGGQIDIISEVGQGTTIHIKLPLTLAIVPSLMISSNKQNYAIPLVNVMELLRIPHDKVDEKIEYVGNAIVVRLREELLPILGLKQVLQNSETTDTQQTQTNLEDLTTETGELNIVVVSAGLFKYGLVVDKSHDSEEIVVKPLGKQLKKCKAYAGATILGNGQVALILEVANIAKMANLTIQNDTDQAAKKEDEEQAHSANMISLLTFGSGENENFAVPVDLVERIEKVKSSDIEEVGGKRVIKYRGGLLEVHSIDEASNVKPIANVDSLLVIVFNIKGQEVGLLATSPVDTAQISVEFDRDTLKQTGIAGSVIIDEDTVLIINVDEMIRTINPAWFIEQNLDLAKSSDSLDLPAAQADIADFYDQQAKPLTILYAEDSQFFRQQVKSFLESDGYKVLDAEDGEQAWELLQTHSDEISMILTDIEMPVLGGLGLAKRITSDPRYSNIPIVALTTLADEKNIRSGKEAGVTEYQVKLDKEKLIKCIHNFVPKN